MTPNDSEVPNSVTRRRLTKGGRRIPKRDQAIVRQLYPYGFWLAADGREVLFNRRYQPILERRPGGKGTAANPNEWVPWIRQTWFYTDADVQYAKTFSRCISALSKFRDGMPIPPAWAEDPDVLALAADIRDLL